MSTYSVAGIEVLHTPSSALDHPGAHYDGLQEGSTTLKRGYQRRKENRAFEVDTIFDRDIPIPMRDGTILRADVFRPANVDGKIPALVAWSPYGKSGTGSLDLSLVPGRAGIPESMVSGFQSFEAFDPAEWVNHDYAVVNVNARGIMGSQGTLRCIGTAEGRDGHDAIEYISQLPWCTGKVALMGNSWLALAQWFIAAERPPHLTCILPLEGLSDAYRESICRGGVPYLPFWGFLGTNFYSAQEREDIMAMLMKYPLMNDYWEDKRAKINLINVPAYVLASMSTGLHTVGSLRCFEDIPHDAKWLRVNPTQEWHDLYQEEAMEDLRKFLDYYTKGISNGWQETPKARVSVLRYNQAPLVNVPFADWPIPDTVNKSLWLSNKSTLVSSAAETESGKESYASDAPAQHADADSEHVEFTYTFDKDTTLAGPAKAVLFMSCPDHDDMDVFVILRKKDKNGRTLRNINIPASQLPGIESDEKVPLINPFVYIGPSGVLRASHHTLDPKLSKPHWPAHDHTQERKITPGQVVQLEIGLWPAAIHFEAGESIALRIAGHQMVLAEFEPLRGRFKTSNQGRHEVHFGGDYQSRIILPLVQI